MNAAMFQQLFDTSPNACMVLDRELRYVAANRAYLRVTASTLEQLVGRKVIDVFSNDPGGPNDEPARLVRESLERVLRTGKADPLAVLTYGVTEHAPDGIVTTERSWSATHTPLLDEDGTVQFIVQHTVGVTDLTRERGEQKRAEAENTEVMPGVSRRAEHVQTRNLDLDLGRSTLRQIFDQAPVFTAYMSGRDHVFDVFNARFQQLVGHRAELGKTVAELLPEAADQGFLALLDGVFDTGVPFIGSDVQFTLQLVPGGPLVTRYADFVYQPIRGEDGVVRGIFVIGNDVTERQTATSERERLAAIVEQCEDFIGTADLHGRLTFVNEAGFELLGLSPEQLATTPAAEVFLPADLHLVQGSITQGLEAHGRWRGELHMRNFATGAAIPVDYNVFALRQPGSDTVTEYASFTRDLRARYALEEERLFLADAIPSQVWTADPHGGLTYVNRQVTDYFGRGEEQMLRDGWQGVVHEDDLTDVIERWTRSLASGDDYEVEFRLLRTSDGAWRWHMGRAHAMKDANGLPLKWYGTNVDIDDARQASIERDALIGKLERSNKELDRFAYVASHDLKTPLRGIGNLAQWIEDDLGDRLTPESREHLELLRGRVARMDALIDGVLRYSRTASPEAHVQEVDVHDLVDVVVDLLSPPDGVRVTTADDLPVLRTPYVALQQVLLNLIGNAVKHAGRPDVHVHVSAVTEGAFYRFTVSDSGRGVPLEHRERVWALFQTLGEPGLGDGIGLSVVKRVVESQGGSVRVEQGKDGGAAVSFSWPRSPDEPADTPTGARQAVKIP